MPTGVYPHQFQPAAPRFWAKVQKTRTCWLWTGATISSGYGQFRFKGRQIVAHRWAYEDAFGPIPKGLDLDHLCRNRNCVRPSHLEPVTRRENVLRGEGLAAQNAVKTHCPQGHPYTGDNLYVQPGGGRRCRTCHRERSIRRYYERRKNKVA